MISVYIISTFTVFAATPTIGTFSNITKNYGDAAFTITNPTSNSTGAFSYTSSNTSVATINGSIVTIVGVGNATITATQAATGNYNSGTTTATLTVNKANPTIGFLNISPHTYGDAPFTLPTPTSSSPGAFTFTSDNASVVTISGNKATVVGVGNVTITATQAATANYTSNFTSASIYVSTETPTIGTLTIPGKTYGSAPFTLTDPTSNSSGAFTYTSSNTSIATVSGNTVTIVGAGTTTITATQAANGNYGSGTTSALFTVGLANPTIGTLSNITKTYGDAPFTVSAPTSNSPGTFSFTSSNTAVATTNGNTVTIVGVGTAFITAAQASTGNYTSGHVYATLTVNPAAPTLSNFNNISKTLGASAFILTDPTSNSSGSFSYASSNPAVATINGNIVTIVGVGTTNITAFQGAAGNYTSGSTSATLTVTQSAAPVPAPGNFSYTSPNIFTVGNSIAPLSPTPKLSFSSIGSGLSNPQNVAIDANGNFYVTDYTNNLVKKITPSGTIVTIGSGFSNPNGIAVDAAGNVYVGDGGNNAVKKIDPNGNISTVGSGFKNPYGVTLDAAGNIYVADNGNSEVKKIDLNGAITVTGNGYKGYNGVKGVAVDASGNVYATDYYNNLVRKLAPNGKVTVYATGFSYPYQLAIDASGNLYVASRGDNSVKKVAVTDSTVTTIATGINSPQGVAVDANKNVYVVNYGGHSITKIGASGDASSYTISPALPTGLLFNTITGAISGTPTVASPATTYTITATNSGGSSTTTVVISVLSHSFVGTGTTPSVLGNLATQPENFATETGARLTISPNPVTGGILRLKLANLPPATYTARILDVSGRLVKAARFEHGPSFPESLHADLTPGIYYLQVIGGGKTVQSQFEVR